VLALVVIVVFSICVIVGQTIGARYSVAPPVLLIVFGAALGLIPAIGDIELEPGVVLLLFLPRSSTGRASTSASARSGRTCG
jgi:monovalent cation/hydrogen antiporter